MLCNISKLLGWGCFGLAVSLLASSASANPVVANYTDFVTAPSLGRWGIAVLGSIMLAMMLWYAGRIAS